MASTSNTTARISRGIDPGKTGDLSAARQAAAVHAAEARVAAKRASALEHMNGKPGSAGDEGAATAKPTRRSARGSEVAAREKKERRDARKQGSHSSGRAGLRSPLAGGPAGGARVGTGRRGRGNAPHNSQDSQRAAMKYATDNRAVRWLYDFTTGPSRHLFYLLVAAIVGVGVYMPVRDFYIAHRTEAILQEQKAIRETYNDSLGEEVESLLSQEGIEDAARRDYGMVMPGEKTITVEGLDENGDPVVVDTSAQGEDGEASGGASDANAASEEDPANANGAASKQEKDTIKGADAASKDASSADNGSSKSMDNPKTSAEVEAAEQAVLENSAWYWKVLDVIFFFDGANGMAVVSTGE